MPVPALIVSGFLGAGKTTLVRRLLDAARQDGVRLAIVSNEFGDTGIDRALLDAGQEGIVELDGGCVCCKLSDALGETLERLLTTVRPDRLVLETSGVALPADVLVQFWRPPLSELVSDEVVVVVVDATNAGADDETFVEQVEAADLIVLNKCDLADDVDAAEARLADLSGGRPILRAVRGDVDPALLFPPDPDRLARRDPAAAPHAHDHERFTTVVLEFPGVVEEERVVREIARHGALRAKGFVRGLGGVLVVQGVGVRLEVAQAHAPVPEHLVGKVVLIARAPRDDHA